MNTPESGLHRTIAVTVHPDQARALVQDDFHHFRLAIHHDGTHITGVSGEAVRFPYSLCPQSRSALDDLIGLPLTSRIFDISATINARHQCTHQFDLAALTVAAAARGKDRRYTMFVTDPTEDDHCEAHLTRDDGFSLHWSITGRIITAPPVFAGITVDHGFTAWAADLTDEDLAEAALVLRRAHFVLGGRAILNDLNERHLAPSRGSCYVMQPERSDDAERIPTPHRDGTQPFLPTPGDREWLEGH